MSMLDATVEGDLVHDAQRSLFAIKNLVGAINLHDVLAVMYCTRVWDHASRNFDAAWQHVIDYRLQQSRKGAEPIS